ncbi:MAG: CapA family protein [Candidatus Auribacterota bacterium]|nr:CapA family protein [Candidatus Auribacterota bacterium]
MTDIIIGGDIYPGGSNLPLFQRGDAVSLFHDLLEEFNTSSLSIANLECPLIRKETPIRKVGPVLGASEESLKGIKAAGIDLLNLANNHVMDHGPAGLENTIGLLKNSGLDYTGAGENLASARKILIKNVGYQRVGILGVAEHEFSIATETGWGANPLDVIDIARNISAHRSEFDYLIVLLHGGNEGFPFPRPSLLKTCRFIIEQGADAVICQHSHCPGAWEHYRGGYIVYGQGNLLFEAEGKDAAWYEGFLVRLRIGGSDPVKMELIPFIQSAGFTGVKRMSDEREERFRSALESRSDLLIHREELEEHWNDYCRDHSGILLEMLRGRVSLLQRVMRKMHLSPRISSKKRLVYLHLIRCESYREAILNVLSGEDEADGR